MKTRLKFALACVAAFSAPAFAQQDFSAVQIQTVPVADGQMVTNFF